jgi:predicted nucleic acid-binding protein
VKVLVDTSVWSLAFRRKQSERVEAAAEELRRLIARYLAAIIGPIRQELLSGIGERAQYDALRQRLHAFPDLALESEDYELAAQYFNDCRARGVQGSKTDFLICAVASRRHCAVFTTDRDFDSYERILRFRRHRIGA